MAYVSLYRKYRPLTFSEMVGQEAITKTLKNQIIANRVGHAYLFNGGRGTGKTSAAKILSRVVNCLNPRDGEPCNECEICKEILNGSLTDVVEMDAASNNSVEDIRQIRDEVNFLPTKAKYRVYIIDEVHMLSIGAFNALLKTLEEPPEHVKFILATTEPQKLPVTILSRCQRFDFKRLANEDIIKRLKIITSEEKIKIEEKALQTIAELSEGAMRDGISILERCIQENTEIITDDLVKELAGIPKIEYINKIVKNISEKNEEETLKITEEILKEGKDLYYFLWEIIKYLKDIIVYKSNGKLILYNEKEIEEIKKISEKISKKELFNMIYSLSELENNIKWSSHKNIMFQTDILKLIDNNLSNSLEERITKIENKIENISLNKIEKPVRKIIEEKENKTEIIKKEKNNEKPNNEKPRVENQENFWKEALDILKSSGKFGLYTNLIGAKAESINDLQVEISNISPFGKTLLEQPLNKKALEKALFQTMGKEIQIKIKQESPKKKNSENDKKEMGEIPFNIIDE